MARIVLKLPKMAVSMREGTLVEWLVASGDTVALGQPLYVIETEKTSTEVESPFAGTITITSETGVSYAVGTPIAEFAT